MIQIRHNVFETNSSSTHSLTVCSDEEYTGWKVGEYVFDRDKEKLVKLSSLKKTIQNVIKDRDKIDDEETDLEGYEFSQTYNEDEVDDQRYYTYKQYDDRDIPLERFKETYTSKSGDKIIIFGEFGNDNY
jgi:hypothetical protein